MNILTYDYGYERECYCDMKEKRTTSIVNIIMVTY